MRRRQNIIVGIDLAAKPSNPTGWTLLKRSKVSARHVFTDEEIVTETINHAPTLTAIDAPLNLPKDKGEYMRKADKEMRKKGYPVLPPRFRSMEKLALRASKITLQLKRKGLDVIEIHPASTRKALGILGKDCKSIQEILLKIGLKGDVAKCFLTPHEIDATTAALTGYLHRKQKTELIGDAREGYIVVPKKRDWRTLKL